MWATYRRCLQLGLTHRQIVALKHVKVEAPNGISWGAYEVPYGPKAK